MMLVSHPALIDMVVELAEAAACLAVAWFMWRDVSR